MWFFISPILPFHPLHRPRNLTAEARIFRSLKIKIKDLRNLTVTYHFSWDRVFLKTSQSSDPAFGNRLSRERKEVKIRREDGNDERPFYRSHFYWYSAVIVFHCFDHSLFRSFYSTNTTSTHPWRRIGVGFRWVWKDFVFVYLQICGVDRGFSKLIYVLGRVLDVSETCKLIYFLSQNLKLNLQFKHFFRTAERSLRI